MRSNSTLACVFALSLMTANVVSIDAGVILISTRKNVCTDQGADNLEGRGPGMTTPGDVAMGTLLGNYGYSSRVILDVLLGQEPGTYFNPPDENLAIDLVIWSGSSSSADVPAPPAGIPLMMGEHVTLGNNAARAGSIFMYQGTQSSDPNESTSASKYMKVVAPNHPIMAGIPLDDQARVKIFREQYPDEESHVPAGGRRNFEYRWCTQVVADKAAGTTVLGVLDGAEERSCFAIVDKGGVLANDQPASARMVQMFTNENGSGGSRRVFLALTELGQVLFVRAAKWAMGEELQPYQTFKILEVKQAGPQSVRVSWESSAKHNYNIQASTVGSDWHSVIDEVTGVDGAASSILNISAGPQALFLRVRRTP
jgi:hypothetical protein